MDINEIVQRGYEILDKHERHMHEMEKDMAEFSALLDDAIVQNKIPFNMGNAYKCQLQAIPLAAGEVLHSVHQELNVICQAQGIDLPQPRSGGR